MGPPVFDQAAATRLPQDARVFLLMGGLEGGSMVPDVERMANVVLQSGLPRQNMVLKVVPAQGHNEAFWSSEFREAVLWLFAPQPAG
jgi:alpha-glucosidase